MTTLLLAMAAFRVLIGLAPFVAARPAANLVGFPSDHDNPTTRVMARLFGVRDVGLGVLVVGALDSDLLPFVLLLNLATDLGDALVFAIPLVRRQGIDRGAVRSLAIAVPAATLWLVAWLVLRSG